MVMAVNEGENVVRLKGGDPFIFGRGGEEVEHLRAAGIDVQVVNGITAGLAGMTLLGTPSPTANTRTAWYSSPATPSPATAAPTGASWPPRHAMRASPWSSTWA